MSTLALRSILAADYKAVDIEKIELTTPLARCLLQVPALANSLSKKDLKSLGAVNRECYHTAARSEVWRDAFEPIFREKMFYGPVPQTPKHFTHRDMLHAINTHFHFVDTPEFTLRDLYTMTFHARSLYDPENRENYLASCQKLESLRRRRDTEGTEAAIIVRNIIESRAYKFAKKTGQRVYSSAKARYLKIIFFICAIISHLRTKFN
jgi:hypothetical protein